MFFTFRAALFASLAEQAGEPAHGRFGRIGQSRLDLLDALGELCAFGVLRGPIGGRAAGAVRDGEVAGEAEGLAVGVGQHDHVGVSAFCQLTELDLAVHALEGEAGAFHHRLCSLHGLIIGIQNGHLHAGQGGAGCAVGRAGQGHSLAHLNVDRVAHALQAQAIGRRSHRVVVRGNVPVAGRAVDGHAGAGERDAAGGNVPGRVGAMEHAVGVVGQQHGVGLAAVVQDDALRVLRKQGDEGLDLFHFAGRQGGVAHLHLLVCKAVRQAVGPCRAAHAVLGDGRPVGQAVEVGAPPQHHGGRSQRAGAAAALLEVEARVHVQVHCKSGRQAGEQKHQRQHKAQQLLLSGRCSGIHGWILLSVSGSFHAFTALKYTSL